MSARTEHLAQVLSELEPQVDSGRLAIGLINEKFAATRGRHQPISSPRAMACLIRAAGLTVSRSRRYVNGRHGAYCMIWDSKTEAFTKQSSQSSQSSQTNAWRALAGENIKNQCSQSSQVRGYGENFENIENQCSYPEHGVVEPHENIENFENMDSSTNPKAGSLASQRLQCLQRLPNVNPCGLAGADIGNTTSATSASPVGNETHLQTLQTLQTQRLHSEGGVVVRNADIADIADVFCGADEKSSPATGCWVDELEKLEAVSRAVSDSARAAAGG